MARSIGEGSTGEYRPEPSEFEVPRLSGAGLAGVTTAQEMTREEHLEAVRQGEIGSIHSWELVTAVDGPGTRLTIFFAGCGLRCIYCHNPDTWKMKDGTGVRVEDLLERIARYKAIFDATRGGVTFSGGDPSMQPEFLGKLLRGCQELGIHTCVDTSGFGGAQITDQMIDDMNLVLLDVKSGIPETYKYVTERELAPTVRFGERLNNAGTPMWIRFVLIPGVTDSLENIEAVANIVKHWGSVHRVEVLPFHQMARDKWANLGIEYKLAAVEPPSKAEVEAARSIFRSHGLDTY